MKPCLEHGKLHCKTCKCQSHQVTDCQEVLCYDTRMKFIEKEIEKTGTTSKKSDEEKIESSLKDHVDALNLLRDMIHDLDNDKDAQELTIGRKTFNKGKETRKNLMEVVARKKDIIKTLKVELDGLRNKTGTGTRTEEYKTLVTDKDETEMEIEITNELKRRRKEALDTSIGEISEDDDQIFRGKSLSQKRMRSSTPKGMKNQQEPKVENKNRRNSLPGPAERGRNVNTQDNDKLEEIVNGLKSQITGQAEIMKKLQKESEKNFMKLQEENKNIMKEFLKKIENFKDNTRNQPEIDKLESELRESKEEFKKLKTENVKLLKSVNEMKEEIKKLKENSERNGKQQKEESKKTLEKLEKMNKNMITEKSMAKLIKETKSKDEKIESDMKHEKDFKKNIINKDTKMARLKVFKEDCSGEEMKKTCVEEGGMSYAEAAISIKTLQNGISIEGPEDKLIEIKEKIEKKDAKTQLIKNTGNVFRVSYVDPDIEKENIYRNIYTQNMINIPGWTEDKVKDSITVFADWKRTRNGVTDRWILIRATNELEKFFATRSKIHIGFSNCPIHPTVVITPCGKCGSVYHATRSCEEKEEICWACGSKDHKRKVCKEKTKKCLNCERDGKKETNHYLLDHKKCVIYQKALERAKKMSGMYQRPEEDDNSVSKEGGQQYRQAQLEDMETDNTSTEC